LERWEIEEKLERRQMIEEILLAVCFTAFALAGFVITQLIRA
jgi:hypothetical protein